MLLVFKLFPWVENCDLSCTLHVLRPRAVKKTEGLFAGQIGFYVILASQDPCQAVLLTSQLFPPLSIATLQHLKAYGWGLRDGMRSREQTPIAPYSFPNFASKRSCETVRNIVTERRCPIADVRMASCTFLLSGEDLDPGLRDPVPNDDRGPREGLPTGLGSH